MKQLVFKSTAWKHRLSHGGELRKLRAGRKLRALSTKDPIHLVLKANRECLRGGGLRSYKRYFLIQKLIQVYAKRFFVKIEQISVQGDHVHLLIRITRRSLCQSFLRVLPGQIAQQFIAKGLAEGSNQNLSVDNFSLKQPEKAVTGTLDLEGKRVVTDTPNTERSGFGSTGRLPAWLRGIRLIVSCGIISY